MHEEDLQTIVHYIIGGLSQTDTEITQTSEKENILEEQIEGGQHGQNEVITLLS